MVIREFGCTHFRNYEALRLKFSDNVIIFVGKNGQGKSNLIEGIYFIHHLGSFRTHRLQKLLQFGRPLSQLQATVGKKQALHKTRIELTKSARKVWLDDSPIGKLSEYITSFYAVVFNPDSLYSFRHFPTERRAFFDRFLAFLDVTFVREIRAFRSVHAQKNRLLKGGEMSSLFAWNVLFAEKSCAIMEKRQDLVEHINTILPDLYARIAGRKERLWLEYQPSMEGNAEACMRILEKAADREARAGHAVYGPHRDDFRLLLADRRRDEYFSQGEYRIALLALKLAVSALLEERKAFRPVLILDDLFSELDEAVRASLKRYLVEISNQIFITSTEPMDGKDFPQPRIMEIRAGRVV
jgi:DNA replication and repair protein RecF